MFGLDWLNQGEKPGLLCGCLAATAQADAALDAVQFTPTLNAGPTSVDVSVTIDDLGKDAPGGILDPVRFKESGWFDNDDFWWNPNATDWAYTATWAPNPEDHPMYTPVHRYARNIIVSLNHGVAGWIDWNIVLDRQGGPNHVGNFCGAPIMIDLQSGYVYYTPVYYVLAQLSRTIRPGDRAVQVTKHLDELTGLDAGFYNTPPHFAI